jgi:proprotein convertase subtilisin/kexin type 5
MTCTKCPTSCLTCLNSQNCTTCVTGLYLFEGQCLTNCPTFPTYYYKYDPSYSCIQVCPPPYFGFSGTGKCENTCPSTFFSNITSGACQSCPQGCSTCYGTNCSTCINGYVYVPKYASCSLKCSLANQYFLNGGCVSNCVSGTFLLDDLVTCQNCNPICS